MHIIIPEHKKPYVVAEDSKWNMGPDPLSGISNHYPEPPVSKNSKGDYILDVPKGTIFKLDRLKLTNVVSSYSNKICFSIIHPIFKKMSHYTSVPKIEFFASMTDEATKIALEGLAKIKFED